MSYLEEKFLEQIRQAGLPEPVREYRFHPKRRYLADFAWPDLLILVEIEGGIYKGIKDKGKQTRTGHTFGPSYEKNCTKYNAAAMIGWTVLRFGPNQINGRGRGSKRVYEGINTLREAMGIKMAIKKIVVEEDENSFTGWTLKMDGSDGVPASVGEVELWLKLQEQVAQNILLQERIKQYEAMKSIRKVAEKHEV